MYVSGPSPLGLDRRRTLARVRIAMTRRACFVRYAPPPTKYRMSWTTRLSPSLLPAAPAARHQTSLHDTVVVRARLFAVAAAASSLARHSLQINVLSPSTSAGFRDKHSRWYLRRREPHSQHAISETGGQARCTPLLAPFALDHAQVGVVWLRVRTGSDPLPVVAQGQDKEHTM